MYKLLVCALILSFVASGCFWPFTARQHAVSRVVVNDATSVEVLVALPAQARQKVYFEPFSAGTDAMAGDVLDRFALMMVRGFADGSMARNRFILVLGDDADTAELVIKGRIEEFKRRGYFKKTVSMKVRGDVSLGGSDEVLAVIYAQRCFKDKIKNSDQAAYDIGYVVAQKMSE